MNHKYVTCAGFGGTGSSMVSDLLAEFSNVKSCGNYEWTLAFDIDGVSDLQHYIVDDFDRVKITEGIYRFRRYTNIIKKGYSRKLGEDVSPIFDDYINELVDVSWMGSNNLQVYRYNWLGRKMYYYYCRFRFELSKLFSKNDGYERGWNKPKVLLSMSHGNEKFFLATKKMYGRLLDCADKENRYEYLCFDQLVPIFHFKRYREYFPNIKIITVDRDPRDLYLLNELYWHEDWIPSHDIDTYIKWFRLLREDFQRDIKEAGPDRVLSVKFEDAIYHYDDTVAKIMTFVGLKEEDHVFKKKHFNPEYSIRNTKLWEKSHTLQQEVSKIETELSEFCYVYR